MARIVLMAESRCWYVPYTSRSSSMTNDCRSELAWAGAAKIAIATTKPAGRVLRSSFKWGTVDVSVGPLWPGASVATRCSD